MNDKTLAISCEGLGRTYSQRSLIGGKQETVALRELTLSIPQGVVFGLLGPNGAGKSTAIKLFLGLLKPTSGSAEVLGELPYESLGIRARLGYMPEHDCLPPAISASEFIGHMAQVSGLPPEQARIRAADVLRHVGLHEERYRPLSEYSTGMKQRVKLAQALVHDPEVLILDEPTAALGVRQSERVLQHVRTAADRGAAVIFVTHTPHHAHPVGDHFVVLRRGRVVADEPREALPVEELAALMAGE